MNIAQWASGSREGKRVSVLIYCAVQGGWITSVWHTLTHHGSLPPMAQGKYFTFPTQMMVRCH